MEGTELAAFQIIASAGTARSMFVEAIQLAKKGNFKEAHDKINEGETCFTEGHQAHATLLTSVADGTSITMDLLLTHAEDQMMSAETFKMVAEEIIELYETR